MDGLNQFRAVTNRKLAIIAICFALISFANPCSDCTGQLQAQQPNQLPPFRPQGNGSGGFTNTTLPASPPVVPNGPPSSPFERIASNPNLANTPSAVTDPTGSEGGEVAPDEAKTIPTKNLLQIFHDGGILMYPIAGCSFVLLVFSMERLIFLRHGRVIPKPFVTRVMEVLEQQQIDRDEASAFCEENGSPVAKLISAAIKKWGRPAVEVEQAVLDEGERIATGLRKHLRLMNAISNVSPLLGLLGTVFGMIEAFNAIATADAMGRPEMLASGISQALLTTAAGLVVAIPAYLAYLFFLGRVDRLITEMDQLSQQVVDYVSAEGLQEANRARRARAKAA